MQQPLSGDDWLGKLTNPQRGLDTGSAEGIGSPPPPPTETPPDVAPQ